MTSIFIHQQAFLHPGDFGELHRVKMAVQFCHPVGFMPRNGLYLLNRQPRFLKFRVAEMPPRVKTQAPRLYLTFAHPNIAQSFHQTVVKVVN